MKVIISAGGTGGHIYPALAIINKIKEKNKDTKFLYIGTHNRMEKDIIPKYNIPFESIEIYGFDRKHLFNNFKTINCMIKSRKKVRKIIKEFNPDIVIGVGGYVTYPVIKEAHKLGIKTIIHEQNSIAGKANLVLSKYVDLICVSFQSSMKEFPKEKTVFTGNPCSEDAIKIKAIDKRKFNLDNDKKLVLCVMGSLGSSKINEYLTSIMPLFNGKEYEVVFVTGKNNYDEIIKKSFPKNVKVVPFIDNMTRLMKKTDVLVTRAGASTLSEVIALKVPSILIPSPYVTNNHQYKNAYDLTSKKAAIMLEEKDLKGDILVRVIDGLLNDDKKLNEIKNNLNLFDIPNSATLIYDNIMKIVKRNDK